jgi:hypothetical protein
MSMKARREEWSSDETAEVRVGQSMELGDKALQLRSPPAERR